MALSYNKIRNLGSSNNVFTFANHSSNISLAPCKFLLGYKINNK